MTTGDGNDESDKQWRDELETAVGSSCLEATVVLGTISTTIKVLETMQPGDVLLAITTSGNSSNILAAVEAAHARDMVVIGMTGRDGGKMGHMLRETDVHICVPHPRTARIQEVHILALHCICDGVDAVLMGDDQERTE